MIVINSGKIVLTGNKMEDKLYMTYTGYPGGQKTETAKSLVARSQDPSGSRFRLLETVRAYALERLDDLGPALDAAIPAVTEGGESIVAYEQWIETGEQRILDEIEGDFQTGFDLLKEVGHQV